MIIKTKTIKISIYSLLLAFSLSSFAGFLEVGDKQFSKTKLKESRWDIAISADMLRYGAVFPLFDGKYEQVKDGMSYDLYGANVNFGREFYFGAGFSTEIKLGVMSINNSEEKKGLGSEDVKITISDLEVKHSGQLGYAGIDLGYLIETKYVIFQPFIGAEFGVGKVTAEKNYKAEAIPTITNSDELYDFRVVEDVNFNRLSLGVKFISFKGIYSVFKVSSTTFSPSKRVTTGTYKKYGETNTVRSDLKDTKPIKGDAEIVGSLGFGYLF